MTKLNKNYFHSKEFKKKVLISILVFAVVFFIFQSTAPKCISYNSNIFYNHTENKTIEKCFKTEAERAIFITKLKEKIEKENIMYPNYNSSSN